ncbi:MAG: hypothetical protein A2W93_10505 [Bacteroidetes bacterium GWF2_43_63]|nr:MAG: hypothetical protein A2W94_01965 [Bacteroidetes bacterium GWE2_42_42]OFY52949.1 MAG: hypothetical protein A2W93_10505 [Bacteroidetes bacterium GWF2_43_63]HBG70159.1 hypothetical protein [Bacteroidales bacterium]HCB62234.1 hypothetical protein [Bacteroidales bacterium]
MNKHVLLLFVIISFTVSVTAQQATFIRNYGDLCPDFGMSVCNNNSGGYILCGQSESYTSGAISAIAISIDSLGNQEWMQTYGGSDIDFGQSIDKTPDGGYIICGFTTSFGAGGYDIYLVKTDANGNQQWQKTFGGAGTEYGYCVKTLPDSGFILCGSTTSFGAGGTDAMLIRTDAAGNTVWTKYYGATGNDGVYSLARTSDHGYVLAGYTFNFGAVSDDAWIIETDSAGNQLWAEHFGGNGSERAMSIVQDVNHDFVFSGYSNSYGGGSQDFYLVRIDSAGTLLQDTVFGGLSDDKSFGIAACADHGFIMTGQTESYGNGGLDLYVIKTDSAFNQDWSSNFGGFDDDQGFNIMSTNDGGYITIGNTWSYPQSAWSNILVVKIDSTGFADGISIFNTTQSILRVFPNPAIDFISIETGIIHDGVAVTISDMIGRVVFEQEFTDEKPIIDVSLFESGAYVLTMKTNDTSSSGMFVKQ